MKKKRPAMPVYVKDIVSDERFILLSLAEQGLYWRLLCHQWLEGSIPADPRLVAKIVGEDVTELWRAVSQFFAARDDGRLINRKLEAVRDSQDEFLRGQSEAGKRGAAVRWGGGAPNDAPTGNPNGDPTPTPMRSECVAVAVPVPVADPVSSPEKGRRDVPPAPRPSVTRKRPFRAGDQFQEKHVEIWIAAGFSLESIAPAWRKFRAHHCGKTIDVTQAWRRWVKNEVIFQAERKVSDASAEFPEDLIKSWMTNGVDAAPCRSRREAIDLLRKQYPNGYQEAN